MTRNKYDNGPSEDSFPKVKKEEFGSRYKKISYEIEIRNWIESCNNIWISEYIKSTLIQYGNFLKNMFEPNKEKEIMMNKNINKWCFNDNSTIRSLSDIDDALNQKKEMMVDLKNEMDIFFRNSVIERFKKNDIEVKTIEGNNNYICFNVAYIFNDQSIGLKGHFNFQKYNDGGIWFGIESEGNIINTFNDQEPIKGDNAKRIREDIISKLGKNYINDKSPYLCLKYCNIDSAIQEIADYCKKIKE